MTSLQTCTLNAVMKTVAQVHNILSFSQSMIVIAIHNKTKLL